MTKMLAAVDSAGRLAIHAYHSSIPKDCVVSEFDFPTIKSDQANWLNERMASGDLDNFICAITGHPNGNYTTRQEASPREILMRGNWLEMLENLDPDRLTENGDGDKAIDMISKHRQGRFFSDPMKSLVEVLFKKTHRLGDFHAYGQ